MNGLNANAEQWVLALEGEDYEQGRGALCRVDPDTGERKHCCLGVATDLYQKEVGGLVELDRYAPGERAQSYIIYKGRDDHRNGGTLLSEVQEWLGLKDESGCFDDDMDNNLAAQNDRGTDFKGIAQIIRSHPELFAE